MPEPMDKRIEWLDEERRKTADLLKVMQQRLAGLDEELAKATHLLQDQAAETARLSALASRISQFDDTLAKHRQEVSRQLEDAEERRSEKEKSLEGLRKGDLKEIARTLAEIKSDLSAVERFRQQGEARREEEDRARHLLSIEEGRKQESKRLSELQAEVTGVRSRVDSGRGTLDSVEDRLRRVEVRIAELASGEAERREGLSLWMDQQNLRQVDMDRSWKDWGRRFESFEGMATDLEERIRSYDDTYRALRQQRESLDALIERLERRITEVAEMQRLAEDRFKQEWLTYQAEDQKRWNTYKLSRDELWREHNRLHDRIAGQVGELEASAAEMMRLLEAIAQSSQNGMGAIMGILGEWASHFELREGGTTDART
jgi:chromosome segregation ATPase